jgi:hypothetical protein
VVTALAAPAVVAALLAMVMLVAEAAASGAPHTGLEEEPVAEATAEAEAEATQTATSPAPRAAATMPAAESKKYNTTSLHGKRQRRLPHLLVSTSQSAPTREIQTSMDHQVRCEARPSPMAQMLRPVHRKRWWQQRHQVSLPTLLPGPSTNYMAESLDKYLINEWNQLKD